MLLRILGRDDVVAVPAPNPLPCDDEIRTGPYFRPGCLAAHVCNRTVGVAFIRNDYLALNVTLRNQDNANLVHPVLPALAVLKPTHALLNRGAHFEEDVFFVAGVTRAVNLLLARMPGIQITLRNTPGGMTTATPTPAPSRRPKC